MRRNCIFRSLFKCRKSFIYDIDGNKYYYVRIGDKEWLTSNLKTTKYADGSAIPNLTQATGFSDWYMPSKDALVAMHDELYLYDVGNFAEDTIYRSSTEIEATSAFCYYFSLNISGGYYKYLQYPTRPVREFTSTTVYSLRDIGPAGGWIFHIIDLGGGSYKYYEAAPEDTEAIAYSNIDDEEVGEDAQSEAIGAGKTNTDAIIAQSGHISSGAKLCDDLVIDSWVDDTEGAYCWYDNDIANKDLYGALYNWHAVDNVKGLAPTGWRVASKPDFLSLISAMGGNSVSGGKLKETGLTYWETPNLAATNDVGFNGRGSGARDGGNGDFIYLKRILSLWTSTPYEYFPDDFAYYSLLAASSQASSDPIEFALIHADGYAVRCVRDI